MNSRVFLLFGALLASTAWSQEPATNASAPSTPGFDLRDTVATQAVLVQPSEVTPVQREPIADLEYVPVAVPPPTSTAPPQVPAPK